MQKTNRSLTLEELALLTTAKLVGDPACRISGVNDLKSAKAEDASFLANPRYKDLALESEAGVICIHSDMPLPPNKNFLVSKDPSRTFQQIAELLLSFELPGLGFIGRHPKSHVDPTALIDPAASIGAFSVIEKEASIGKNTLIYPHVYIGPGVQIGEDCIIYPGVVIRERCVVQNRVIIQPGAIIGSCGFGYTFDEKTGKFNKIEQIGIVRIEDDVEIGANTTIDRARFKETVIGRGTKIDNLVQIGHNVVIGENNAIVSQSGLAGSTKTGKNVLIGGQSGIVGHVEIADNVKIATRGGVSKSILKEGSYRGSPVMDMSEYNKQQVYLRKIEKYVKRIEQLEARVQALEPDEARHQT